MAWPFSRRPQRLRHNDEIALLRRAVLALATGDPDAAEEALSLLLQKDSGQADAHLALGNLYRERGEIGRAIRLHQNLLLRKDLAPPFRAGALAELARDLETGGFTRRAIASYREFLELEPKRLDALAALRDLLAGEGDYAEAQVWHRRLENAVGQRDPECTARLLVAEAKGLHAAGDGKRASRMLGRALRLDPGQVSGRLLLADIKVERGRNRAAKKIWRELVETGGAGAATAYRRLSAAGAESGREGGHEKFLRTRLESVPGDTRARRELARQLLAKGEVDESIAQLRALLDTDSSDLAARVELGHTLLSERRNTDALKDYAELLAVLESREPASQDPAR